MLPKRGNRSAAVPIRADKTFPGAVGIGQVAVPGTEVVLTGVDARARLEEVSGAAKLSGKATVAVRAVKAWTQGVGAEAVVAVPVAAGAVAVGGDRLAL